MTKYFVVYGNKTNLDFNLHVVTRPVKPSAEMQYEEINIPGREPLYRGLYYKDIEVPISFNFVSKPSEWENVFRRIKRWINSGAEILKFSDDLEAYYKVKRVRIDTPERVLKRLGKFTVIFTCSPYVYFCDGMEERELGQYLYNNEMLTKPVYRITGEGLLKLNINGKEVQINVGQEVIVNTELGLCFRNGVINNVALKGSYADMYLQEGDNTFVWSGNFKIYIIPNWRCLS